MGIVFGFGAIYILWFFRNPRRKPPSDPHAVVSPADGRVLEVEEVDGENDLLEGRYKKISIFMNLFNVHVNRAPFSGYIKKIHYRPGAFFSANLDKASIFNERNALIIATDNKVDILVIQIAGLIARRIVCWKKEHMRLERGERFGLIRFGSRLEVYLPLEAEVSVSSGDKVKAGVTAIGRLL